METIQMLERLDHWLNEAGWQREDQIGHGSQSYVYRISRTTKGRQELAVVKVISVNNEDYITDFAETEEAIKNIYTDIKNRYLAEYQLLDHLKGHPNIISFDAFICIPHDDGIGFDIYMRMPLLKPLRSVMDTPSFTTEEIIKLGIDICSALIVLQQHNIIHRDVKPDNLLVNQSGDYILGDFSVSATTAEWMTTMAGTPLYLAPEICRGKKYTSNVDIYSLGITLYRLASGTLPFLSKGEHAPLDLDIAFTRRMQGEIPSLEIDNVKLRKTILKAIQPDPNLRYQSPQMMQTDLKSALEKEVIPAPISIAPLPSASTVPNPAGILWDFLQNCVHRFLSGRSQTGRVKTSLDVLKDQPVEEVASILHQTMFILKDKADKGDIYAKNQLEIIQYQKDLLAPKSDKEYFTELTGSIFDKCRKLMEFSAFNDKTEENILNDYLRDLLHENGYDVLDQTRQGNSGNDSKESRNRGAGEIDIKINRNRSTFTLAECLRVSSVEKEKIAKHIHKLLVEYDPVGVYGHILIIYYNEKNFYSFATKLVDWLILYDFPFPLLSVTETEHRDVENLKEFDILLHRQQRDEPMKLILLQVI